MARLDAWLRDAYGGKKAFLSFCQGQVTLALGRYSGLSQVDFSKARRLVFVCKGNICRSPYAEAAARASGLNAISAGLEASPNRSADATAAKVALEMGIDLSGHRTRRFDQLMLRPGDLVVTFEPAHAAQVALACNHTFDAQLTAIGLFARAPFAYLHDPYGTSPAHFRASFRRINAGLTGLSARLPEPCRVPRAG